MKLYILTYGLILPYWQRQIARWTHQISHNQL